MRLDEDETKRAAHPVLMADPAPSGTTPELLNHIKTLHSNLGHSSSRALARAIKMSGGSDQAVQAAVLYRFPVCTRLKEPKPTNPGKLTDKYTQFGDLVCVDLLHCRIEMELLDHL